MKEQKADTKISVQRKKERAREEKTTNKYINIHSAYVNPHMCTCVCMHAYKKEDKETMEN